MVIGEIFQDNINRLIQPVVKVDEKNDDVLVQELEEYVITNDLKKHFMTFFNSYQESFEGRTTDIGVWISGFFGSGKSHFLKMLSYLLANKEVKGVRTVERFRKKFKDDLGTFMPIDSVTRGQTDTILFNIDTEGPMDKNNTAVLRVFAKMFYNYLGFYGEDLKVTKLEQHLEEQGKTEEFHRVFQKNEEKGIPWTEARKGIIFYEAAIVKTLQEVLGMSETTAYRWVNSTETVEMSISKLVSEIKEYVDSKPEGFRLFFMLDEVGQYIGEDLSLLLNLQSLVERIGSECGGKVWIVCTGQEAVDEIIKARENEFSRIQARFKIRLSLTSSSVDEVIQKRILKKTSKAESDLKRIYEKNDSILKNLFAFNSVRKNVKGYKNSEDFSRSFPFVPYQFMLLQNVFTEIRNHGHVGIKLSDGARSMISAFQEATKKIQDKDETALVPFYLFYDTIEPILDSNITKTINDCQKMVDNGDGIEAKDMKLLKLLYLIRYVDDIPANLDNLVILMADKIDMDKVKMRESVRGSLDRLLGQNYIGRSGGDTYNFLTDEEQEIQREIYKNTHVDISAIIGSIGKKIFAGIYEKKKYHLDNYDFPFDKFVDDKAIEAGTGGVKLTILTAATDIYDKDESRLIGESFGQAIVVLADTLYYQPIENAEKIKKYTSVAQGIDLSESKKQILRHHQDDANDYEKIAKEELEKAIVNARFYVHGEKIDIKTGDAKSKIEQAMKYLITHVYNKLGQITKFAKDDNDIRAILQGKHMHGVMSGMESNHEAATEMEDFLEIQSIKANTTTMADLQKRYQAAPFGWREIDIASVVAMLIYAQKVTVKYGGNTIQADDKELVGLLRKRYEIGKTLIAKRQLISERKIKQVKDILREYFDVMNLPDDEDSLVAFMVEKFEEQKAHYEEINRKYLGKTYPDQELVEKGIRLVNGILSQKKDNTAITDRLIQEEDNLLDNKEDLEKVENFFKGPVRVFDEAVTMESRLRDDVSYLKKNEKASLALEEIKKIIGAQQNVYRRIPELNDLMATVREGHVKLVFEKRQELGKIVRGCAEEIKVAAEGNEKCMSILTKAHDFFTHFEDRIAEQNSLAILDGMVQQLWVYKDETIEKLEIAKRPSSVVTPEAPVPSIPGKVSPKRKSKAIYRQQFPKKVLGSEADVDAYVEELRAYLKKMMESGDEIDLK